METPELPSASDAGSVAGGPGVNFDTHPTGAVSKRTEATPVSRFLLRSAAGGEEVRLGSRATASRLRDRTRQARKRISIAHLGRGAAGFQ